VVVWRQLGEIAQPPGFPVSGEAPRAGARAWQEGRAAFQSGDLAGAITEIEHVGAASKDVLRLLDDLVK
jgi:hypothetical protein